ncbi:MAG: phosphate transport system ATP-binding protein, partial [Solirubrobacterales bacterium]|nr:phosphate transport system ATP-binding protein [Solirubrobacterales bacterium]
MNSPESVTDPRMTEPTEHSRAGSEPARSERSPRFGALAAEGPGDGATATVSASLTRRVVLEGLHAYYGDNHAVNGIDLSFEPGNVTAIIGPSGCGKSTMVRCVNRMHEEIPGARAEGRVLLDGFDLYAPEV